jgi:hypothetical protein
VIDRREAILARLRVLIGTIPGVVKAVRNGDELSGRARPAVFMHDAVEARVDTGEGGPPDSGAQLMRLSPQVALLMGEPTEAIGPAISEFRRRLVVAVLGDAELRSLTGIPARKTAIRFDSCAVTTEAGETREGRADLVFEIDYDFKLSDLT